MESPETERPLEDSAGSFLSQPSVAVNSIRQRMTGVLRRSENGAIGCWWILGVQRINSLRYRLIGFCWPPLIGDLT